MVDSIHIRITGGEDDRFDRIYIQNAKKYFVVIEEATRTHTHAHVEELMVKIQTIRNKLSEMTNRNEGKVFSISTVKDRHKNLLYLCKGADRDTLPVVKLNTLLTLEQITEYHNEYWENMEKYEKEKEAQKVTVGKKTRQKTFLELCIDEARKDEYKDKWNDTHTYITGHQKRAMFMLVTGMLGQKAKILDSLIIRRLCNGVFNVILPLKYRDEMLFNLVYPDSVRLGDD